MSEFNVGEDVVLKAGESTEIMTVCDVGTFLCPVAFDNGFYSGYPYSHLRLATPEEIKAGRRLP